MIPGEVDFSHKGAEACEAHRGLCEGSPDILRLPQLVLQTVFRSQGFRLVQIYLFHIANPWHTELGETIGSLLCASYPAAGAINFEQAGISQSELPKTTDGDWTQVVINAGSQGRNAFRHLKANTAAWMAQLTAEEERRTRNKLYADTVEWIQQNKPQYNALVEHIRALKENLGGLGPAVEAQLDAEQARQAENQKIWNAMQRFRHALGCRSLHQSERAAIIASRWSTSGSRRMWPVWGMSTLPSVPTPPSSRYHTSN